MSSRYWMNAVTKSALKRAQTFSLMDRSVFTHSLLLFCSFPLILYQCLSLSVTLSVALSFSLSHIISLFLYVFLFLVLSIYLSNWHKYVNDTVHQSRNVPCLWGLDSTEARWPPYVYPRSLVSLVRTVEIEFCLFIQCYACYKFFFLLKYRVIFISNEKFNLKLI